MKCVWLTDIHLNFIDAEERQDFYQDIVKTNSDVVLMSGDIAEAPSVVPILKEMFNEIKKPIYCVLGNHDYYRGQVDDVKNEMTKLTQQDSQFFWLPASGPITLNNNTVVLGQDGWADGRYGDYANSPVSLNDSRLIADLFQSKILGKYPLLEKMQQLADDDAMQLQRNLMDAIEKHKPEKIIVVTHVPPFKEACLYQGKISGDDFLPFFGSKIMGDVLTEVATDNTEIEFLVLCGHTHGKACYQPLDNLIVKVGHAEYMKPEIQEVIAL